MAKFRCWFPLLGESEDVSGRDVDATSSHHAAEVIAERDFYADPWRGSTRIVHVRNLVTDVIAELAVDVETVPSFSARNARAEDRHG